MQLWVSYTKKPVPMSSFFLFIAGCSRRIQYASSIRRRRPSRVEQSTLNLISGLSVTVYNQLSPTSIIYVRYIDDTNTIANDTEQAHQMLEYINSCHETIKFDLETPNANGYLPILDIMIKISASGQISRKHYRRKANCGLTLHFKSHHASAIKKAIVTNEYARATTYSTPDNMQESIRNASQKLRLNKYPERWIKTDGIPNHHPKKQRSKRKENNNTKEYYNFHLSTTASTQ